MIASPVAGTKSSCIAMRQLGQRVKGESPTSLPGFEFSIDRTVPHSAQVSTKTPHFGQWKNSYAGVKQYGHCSDFNRQTGLSNSTPVLSTQRSALSTQKCRLEGALLGKLLSPGTPLRQRRGSVLQHFKYSLGTLLFPFAGSPPVEKLRIKLTYERLAT
jgi:hypothetical protein